MRITILKPGLLSTVQDMGRPYHLSDAVPLSGAMDTVSARIANKALGNSDNDAVIEFTYADASFVAETDLLIAYAGGGATLMADQHPLPCNRPIFIPMSTTLTLKADASGARTYLAVAGGWDVPDVLGSKSTCLIAGFGGFKDRALKKGDVLNATTTITSLSKKILDVLQGEAISYSNWAVASPFYNTPSEKTIRVLKGNEFDWFDKDSKTEFLSQPFKIGSQSNRMGYQLEGSNINRITTNELLSTAVCPGTIQVTANGTIIILMADCQTTGGYPRIGQVITADLPLCAQLKPGDIINFKQVSLKEAEKQYLEQQRDLRQISCSIALKIDE